MYIIPLISYILFDLNMMRNFCDSKTLFYNEQLKQLNKLTKPAILPQPEADSETGQFI